MALKFYYNNTTYSLADDGSWGSSSIIDNSIKPTPTCLHYYNSKDSTFRAEKSIPASSTRGTSVQFAEDDNYYYYMDNSFPTLCFRKNDTTYYCAKSITTEAKYNIPAGTYTPSAFETLIKQYISVNGLREVSNDFTVTVNGQTVSVSSGSYIYYIDNSSSGSTLRGVCFGVNNSVDIAFSVAVALSTGFTKYKTYITYRSPSDTIVYYFNNYANYNITVTTGINFS